MSDDPYLYENTTVLKNNINTKDQDHLDRFEKRETTIALKNLRDDPVKGRFDLQHLQEIHKRIFKDVYPFAGQIRTVNLYKAEQTLGGASVEYASPANIRPQAQESLERLNQRDWSGLKDMSKPEDMKDFAKNVTDIWEAHPFREGNTRTTMTFVGQFAKERGFALDNELLSQHATFVRASLVYGSFVDKTEHLTRILTDARQRELVKETERAERLEQRLSDPNALKDPQIKSMASKLALMTADLKKQGATDKEISVSRKNAINAMAKHHHAGKQYSAEKLPNTKQPTKEATKDRGRER